MTVCITHNKICYGTFYYQTNAQYIICRYVTVEARRLVKPRFYQ